MEIDDFIKSLEECKSMGVKYVFINELTLQDIDFCFSSGHIAAYLVLRTKSR